ncbi:MAG TPA: ParB/RepB/Spo0J family partition protein [Clostridiales bacterium]|nr:ParB/RepB/Spo0J family partition protein [Clostridiales bacterium]
MAVRKGLGKGLDSMIPEQIKNSKDNNEDNVSRETLININEIEPNKTQPRKNFDEDALNELSDSIKQYGIIQPLILQKMNKGYEIIAGERRWRAARIAGLKKVPAIIKEYTDQEIVEIALIENIQREDLNPIEEALAYQRLIQEFNLKQEDVADRVSKSRTAVTNSMRLLKLDQRIQQMLIDETISSGHARALLGIEDKEKQHEAACKVIESKLSVRETEKFVRDLLKVKEGKNDTVINNNNQLVYRDIEEKIRSIMGTKVSIRNKQNNTGKIEIDYYSIEELERILELFQGILND